MHQKQGSKTRAAAWPHLGRHHRVRLQHRHQLAELSLAVAHELLRGVKQTALGWAHRMLCVGMQRGWRWGGHTACFVSGCREGGAGVSSTCPCGKIQPMLRRGSVSTRTGQPCMQAVGEG